MKKLGLIIFCLLIGVTQAQAKDLIFALVPESMDNVFFERSAVGCKKAAGEFKGVRCDYIGPSRVDAVEQVRILRELIAKHVDGIAVAGCDVASLAAPLKAAQAAGIPVVTFETDLLKKDRGLRATYIGTDNYNIGKSLAVALQEMKPDGGTICIQTGQVGEDNLNDRVRGVRETLSGRKGIKGAGRRLRGAKGWTEVDDCPRMNVGDSMAAVKQMDEILAKYPELTAFVAVGGGAQLSPAGYGEVMGRYKERIKSKKTLILASDTLPAQMAFVAEGLSHVNVGQRSFDMGYKAMIALKALSDGKKVVDPLYTGLDICTPETHVSCLRH